MSLADLSPRWGNTRALDALKKLLSTAAAPSLLFEAIDSHGQGFITHDELQAFADASGLNLPPASVAAVIALGDRDGTGHIDTDEWRHLGEVWAEIDSLRAELDQPAAGPVAGPSSPVGDSAGPVLKAGFVGLDRHGQQSERRSADVWAILQPGQLELFAKRPRATDQPAAPLKQLVLMDVDAVGVGTDGKSWWADTKAARRWNFRLMSGAQVITAGGG